MARNMDGAEFAKMLKFRAVASQAVQILGGDTESTMSFKKEVGVVTNTTKSSSYLASNCCDNSSSHSSNCISEAERHVRGRLYDSSHDRSSGCRRSGSFLRRSDSNSFYKLLLYFHV